MRSKQKQFTIGLFLAVVGVILLGFDRVLVSADEPTKFGPKFTVMTIVALGILLVAAIWILRTTVEKK